MPRRGVDLTEDQWARVKSHAATRRQTISQFIGDVVNEILPDGHVRPQTVHVPIDAPREPEVPWASSEIQATTTSSKVMAVKSLPTSSYVDFRPAPKPRSKK